MGVTGLWKLIEPCGQPVPVEMLENKILAIDISIWLHQVVKGFQDNKGSALANAHLLGLFHRLCKLMYYRIKPIFVFDGKVPLLKKDTIAKRNLKRNKLINESDRIQALLLESLAKEKVVQQALGIKTAADLLKASPSKNRGIQKRHDIDDMFKLPDDHPLNHETEKDNDLNSTIDSTLNSESDISTEDSKPRQYCDQNLQGIDVKSKYFRNLPADIRHEILVDIKETRKQSSWGKLHELPSKGNDFSLFQMKRLLKRRQVQECLEETAKEMDNVRTFTLNELENIFSEEGIIEPSTLPNTKHISSDSNTRYLLVRDLKKTLAAVSKSEATETKSDNIETKLERSASASASCLNEENSNELGEEYDEDLQKAIQMSLDQSAVYDATDYEYNGRLKLSKEQKKNLKNTAVGLARAYMMEHAGMNEEDIQGLLMNTQVISDDEEFCLTGTDNTGRLELDNGNHEHLSNEIKDEDEIGVISDSNSDSELEDVSTKTSAATSTSTTMEICVDTSKKISQDDDMFADIFSPKKEENKIENKPSSSTITQILQDLKKQASEVNKITLSDIGNHDSSIIELPDDENVRFSKKQETLQSNPSEIQYLLSKEEGAQQDQHNRNHDSPIIELPDDENLRLNQKQETLQSNLQPLLSKEESAQPDQHNPAILIKHSQLNNSITEDILDSNASEIIEIIDDSIPSEILSTCHTPSKKKAISEFFEMKYVIKRTPEKIEESKNDFPKVKSPFFIKKTPKSSEKLQRKRLATDDEFSPPQKTSKASKILFKQNSADNSDVEPINMDSEPVDSAKIATNLLKENKTEKELQDIASSLAKEKNDLEKERNRQDRMGMTITEKMNSECMQLLRLFGIPFIVAPMEAEAQCAFLDAMHLTNGTITDDSDIWLFGGQTVYKNFFAQNKHVMEFKSDKIENSFNVDRNKLIQLALLVGSDYTTGVHGIGAVTALEILATFSVNEQKETNTNQQTSAVLRTLTNFRDWWASAKSSIVIGNSIRHRLRNKLKNIELTDGFPSHAVVDAYLTPTVDNNQETFSWGSPDVEAIGEFTRTNFGWTRLKTNEILGPILKRINEKRTQSTIKNYFAVKSVSCLKQMPVSKRVQTAINKLSSDYKSDEEKNNNNSGAKPKRRGRKKAIPSNEVIPKKSARTIKQNDSTSSSLEIIPQREKDLQEMQRKKELAAAVLKKSKSKKNK